MLIFIKKTSMIKLRSLFISFLATPMFPFLLRNQLAMDDFNAWRNLYKINHFTKYKAFCKLMHNSEYRFVFYYRQSIVIRYIFNFFKTYYKYINIIIMRGWGLLVFHGYSTIVVANTIGKNFNLYQNVTIGYHKNGKPSIGDNVMICAGAVVAGNIKIGNNVKIGANATVFQDITDNSIVYGNPCIIKTTTK